MEINTLGAIVPFDTRHATVEQYEKDGKIEVVKMISPNLQGDYYSEINTALTTTIQSGLEFDGIWTASTAFLDPIFDSMHSLEKDYVVTGIDISDTEVQRLATEPDYYCCAAVDPYVIGMVDVRIGVSKVLGVETPEEYKFDAVGVSNADVTKDDSMATLAEKIPGFGSSDAFLSDELNALYK